MEILDPNHKYAIWTSNTAEILYLKNVSSHATLRIMHKGDDIEYNTNYVDIFIKYEDALFLYNSFCFSFDTIMHFFFQKSRVLII